MEALHLQKMGQKLPSYMCEKAVEGMSTWNLDNFKEVRVASFAKIIQMYNLYPCTNASDIY